MNVKVFPLLEDECLFWDFLKRKGGHLNCDKRSKYHILYNNSCVVIMPKWMCFRHVVHYNNIKIINIVFSNLNHIGKVSRS